MTNPNPWPSIENLSKWYATTTITVGEENEKITRIDGASRREEKMVYAYEKVDGTNLGLKCDGTIYGRRTKLTDGATSYQKVPLGKHNIPSPGSLESVKSSLLKLSHALVVEDTNQKDDLSPVTSQLILYGELVCNPERYGYQGRGMKSRWLCFGGILEFTDGDENDVQKVSSSLTKKVSSSLTKKGFLARLPFNTKGTIFLGLNPTLVSLLAENGIECVPFVDQGTLKDVCLRQKELMMESGLEGLVITGDRFIKKWKIGDEDESTGLDELKSVIAEKEKEKELRNKSNGGDKGYDRKKELSIDMSLANCLMEVAANKTKRLEKKKKTKNSVQNAYDHTILSKVIASALSKYDALDLYFSNNNLKWIKNALVKELVDDLSASSQDQQRCINSFVGQVIGDEYKQWKQKR